MKLSLIIFLLFLLPLNAYGAGFDCTKASSEVEKTICENKWLGELDEELSYYYAKLRGSLTKKKASKLLKEQREWIHERNKACETVNNKKSCLSNRYRKRVNQLKIQYEEPLLPGKEELNSICSEIANLDSSGRREYGDKVDMYDKVKKVNAYDINNDGIKEIAVNCNGGTMHVPCVEYKLPDGSPLQQQTINYEWKTYWTYGLKPFRKNGKWFRLHSYDGQLVKPAYLSYITPENNEYVVCEFYNKEVEEFTPNEAVEDSNELCHEVMIGNSKKIKNIQLTDKPIISRSDVKNSGREETGLERQGFLDYNNDGIPNYVGELEYASGAGRGCDYNYFDELSEDRKSFLESKNRNLLLKMQKVDLEGRHPNCGSSWEGKYMNHFFKFNNKIYYEFKTRKDRAIYKLEDFQILEVCKVKKSYKTGIKSIGIPNK